MLLYAGFDDSHFLVRDDLGSYFTEEHLGIGILVNLVSGRNGVYQIAFVTQGKEVFGIAGLGRSLM